MKHPENLDEHEIKTILQKAYDEGKSPAEALKPLGDKAFLSNMEVKFIPGGFQTNEAS